MSEFDLPPEARVGKPPFVGAAMSEFHAFSHVTDSGVVVFSDKKLYHPGDPMPITNFWTLQGALSFARVRAKKLSDNPILLMSDLKIGDPPDITDIYVGSIILPEQKADTVTFLEITDPQVIREVVENTIFESHKLLQLASPATH